MMELMGGKGAGKGMAKALMEGRGPADNIMKGKGGYNAKDAERLEDLYSWTQKGDEVQVTFKLPKRAAKKEVKIKFEPKTINVAVHGNTLLEGSLGGTVDVDTCTWCLAGSGSELQVMLTKKNVNSMWKNLLA